MLDNWGTPVARGYTIGVARGNLGSGRSLEG